jgi:hypothetical protein
MDVSSMTASKHQSAEPIRSGRPVVRAVHSWLLDVAPLPLLNKATQAEAWAASVRFSSPEAGSLHRICIRNRRRNQRLPTAWGSCGSAQKVHHSCTFTSLPQPPWLHAKV